MVAAMDEAVATLTSSTLKDAALSYIDKGLAVFPIRPKSKNPASSHGFLDAVTDPEQITAAWDAKPNLNIGIATGALSGGLFVIDLDTHDDADGSDTLNKWEAEHGELPSTATALTGGGGIHMFYRGDGSVHSSVSKTDGVDIRGEGGYVVAPPSVHPSGAIYEWERGHSPEDIPISTADRNVLAFIASVQRDTGDGARFVLPDEVGKGERNNIIFKLACSMQSKGASDEEIMARCVGENVIRFKPPLSDDELRRSVESALQYEKGDAKPQTQQTSTPPDHQSARDAGIVNGNGKVIHNAFARLLINQDHACNIDGAPAIWNGRRYEPGWDAIDRAIVRHHDACKMTEQREIRNYIRLMAPTLQPSDPKYIAFANGVLDIRTGIFGEYTPDMVITNVIPWEYHSDAECDAVEDVLTRMACDDTAVIEDLKEIIGVCMYRANDIAQCPLLLGAGSNGKSTYIKMLHAVLGRENVSSLDINIIGKAFQAGQLVGKLANLGDDISNEFLTGDSLAIFKKIASGDTIYTDVKNGTGFNFRPYATMVFSANDMPNLGDSSDGMMRRLFPVCFNATFSPDDPDFDPRITEKVTSREACEYMCLIGMIGLSNVLAANRFTPNTQGTAELHTIKANNDTVVQWVEDTATTAAGLVGAPVGGEYAAYVKWCEDSRVHPVSKNKFSRKIHAVFDIETVITKTDGRAVRMFVSS